MTPEEQRIAIAEYCGWTRISNGPLKDARGRAHYLFGPWGLGGTPLEDAGKGDDYEQFLPIPDYLNDLNAMHEAEKILSSEPNPDPQIPEFTQQEEYTMHLEVLTKSEYGIFKEIHANAALRAEAFLKTIKKYA